MRINGTYSCGCRQIYYMCSWAAGEFLALRAAQLLDKLPSADEDAALLAAGAPPDLALSLGLRQRKRRLLTAAAQAGW